MKGLGRLAALYGRIERLEAVSARVAADALSLVVREHGREQACGLDEQARARVALGEQDRLEWRMANSALELSGLRLEKLAHLQASRERVRDEAMRHYMASRLKTQQVQQALMRRHDAAVVVERRQAQAAADDRFGSRLGWTRAQQRMRVDVDEG